MFGFFTKADGSQPLIDSRKAPTAQRSGASSAVDGVSESEETQVLLQEIQRRDEDHKLEMKQRERELSRKFENEMSLQASELMKLRDALEESERSREILERTNE